MKGTPLPTGDEDQQGSGHDPVLNSAAKLAARIAERLNWGGVRWSMIPT